MTPAEFWGSTVAEVVTVVRGAEQRHADAMRADLVHAYRTAAYGRFAMMVEKLPSLPPLHQELQRFDRAMSGKSVVTVEITSREQLRQLLAEARSRAGIGDGR
jgi:hypothetical protein